MHKFLNNVALAGSCLALALTPAMVIAQDDTGAAEPEATAPKAAMTSEQDAAMQSWPAEQRTAFKLWPAETQAYLWSLTEARQKLFWVLADSDKVALSRMAEPQRESVWAQIESRAAAPSQS